MQKMELADNQDSDDNDEDMDTGVVQTRSKKNKKKTERDIELELGDDYILDLNKKFDLANPDEKYDVIPEIWNGHNVADYVDTDIMAKLDQLEKEEELRERAGVYDSDEEVISLVF